MLKQRLYSFKVGQVDNRLYRVLRGRWHRAAGRKPRPGYTIFLTFPPDLPVYLRISLDVLSRQDLTYLDEILLIPDRVIPDFRARYEWVNEWSLSPIRLVELRPLDRFIRAKTNNTSVIHWLQIINGCEHTDSDYALLHDVDLFLFDPAFIRQRYERCVSEKLVCLGVSRRVDMAKGSDPELGNNNVLFIPELEHMLGTWELMFSLSWARSFLPSQLRPQYHLFRGRLKNFDTLHLAQFKTEPSRVACQPESERIVHFGAMITQYRMYQRSRGVYEDRLFRLLLTRLLVDAYDSDSQAQDLPSLDELVAALNGHNDRIRYPAGPDASSEYRLVRQELDRLLKSGLLGSEKVQTIESGLQPFDMHYAG